MLTAGRPFAAAFVVVKPLGPASIQQLFWAPPRRRPLFDDACLSR